MAAENRFSVIFSPHQGAVSPFLVLKETKSCKLGDNCPYVPDWFY